MNEPADIASELRVQVAGAISKRRMGTDYGFDVGWVLAQTPAGVQVVWQVLITRRSPLLGQGPLFHVAQIMSPRPDAAAVDEHVADGIRQLANLNEQQKRPPEAPPAQVPALANGHRR